MPFVPARSTITSVNTVDLVSCAQAEVQSLRGAALERRGFMLGSLAGGFAASVVPSGELLAQVITTDTQGLQAGEVKIPVAGGDMPAYVAAPVTGTSLPVILVVQEIFGVHEHIKDVARRFAKQGYLAIAPELFARQGNPAQYTSIPELFANVVSKVPDAQVMADLDASLRWAAGQRGDLKRTAITGFCWGGRITWLYSAHNKDLKAGVAWYGRLMSTVLPTNPFHPMDIAEKLNAPVLGLYGGRDDGIPLATVDEMKTRLSFGSKASQASQFVVYPEAPHAFHADYRPSYRKEAADDGWRRCLAWLKEYGAA
jgi:carboxymethylenebutenolidase